MPRYFFDVFDTADRPDRIGEVLPDDAAAWSEGTRVAADLLRELAGHAKPGDQWRLEVTDADGKKLYVLSFDTECVK